MKAIHRCANEPGIGGRKPRVQQLPHSIGIDHVVAGLAVEQPKLPTTEALVAGHKRGGASWVADLLHEPGECWHISAELNIDHEPALVEALVDEVDAELFADRT